MLWYRRGLVAILALIASLASVPFVAEARAEIFFCQSTRGPNGSGKYCNFLLFDKSFNRHRQIVVARGAQRRVVINGRFDVFCVLVQNHTGVPDNIAYRKQQCRETDTGRNYKFPIRELNMRRGRNGFSTDTLGLLPSSSW